MRVWNVSVTKSDDPLAALLDDILGQHWFERGIKTLVDVLEEDGLPHSDSVLDDLEELGVRELYGLNVVVFFHLLDPFVGLRLWVDEQWPPLGLGGDDTVLNGQLICRESLNAPFSDENRVSKNSLDSKVM